MDGQWHYGSFNGQVTVDLPTRPQASCLSCHARAAETDFTYTRPSLDTAMSSGMSQFTCDRGGRSPFELRTYLEGVSE